MLLSPSFKRNVHQIVGMPICINQKSTLYIRACIMTCCRCKPAFDFSDHIVLYIGHYMVPMFLECSYVLSEVRRAKLKTADYAPTLIVSVVLIVLVARAMLFTTMYFHTVEENVLAVGISVVLLVVPVLYSRKSVLYV